MADGYTVLQQMIDHLREVGRSIEDTAADIAPALQGEIESSIAAACAPDGTPWQPTLRGTAPLRNAGEVLGVAAIGTKVIARVTGVEARHHHGTARGGIARPILPGSDLPPQIIELITAAYYQRMNMIMGGA